MKINQVFSQVLEQQYKQIRLFPFDAIVSIIGVKACS